jgi:hypothetical protein
MTSVVVGKDISSASGQGKSTPPTSIVMAWMQVQ